MEIKMEVTKRKIGHWTFNIRHLRDLEREVAWLFSYFEDMERNGVSFHDGMKIGLGWSMLQLRADGAASFSVYEPDFSRNPALLRKSGSASVERVGLLT